VLVRYAPTNEDVDDFTSIKTLPLDVFANLSSVVVLLSSLMNLSPDSFSPSPDLLAAVGRSACRSALLSFCCKKVDDI
jgi:hypothetical protein